MMEAESLPEAERSSAPARRRLWLGAGIALGAGVHALLATLLFRSGSEEAQAQRMKQKVSVLAQDLIRDHWAAMRKAVEQVGTDEGAKAFYDANPGLAV